MATQLNTHTVSEASIMPLAQPILPAVIEHTARKIFESFSEKMKARLNGRQERALKLAVEGHVTYKGARVFSVRSETGHYAYLVNLESGFCTCPDSQKGYVCKHRLAAYLIEQANITNQDAGPQPIPVNSPESNPGEPTPPRVEQDALEKAKLALNARSEFLRETIIYADLPMDGQLLPVEVLKIEGENALVRSLPRMQDGRPIPCFPFPDRQSLTQVIAASLIDVQIYR